MRWPTCETARRCRLVIDCPIGGHAMVRMVFVNYQRSAAKRFSRRPAAIFAVTVGCIYCASSHSSSDTIKIA